jgi:hypothetical protein
LRRVEISLDVRMRMEEEEEEVVGDMVGSTPGLVGWQDKIDC